MKSLDLLKDYRAMSGKALQALVADLRQQVSAQKIAVKLDKYSNSSNLFTLKKTLARALTILTEKQAEGTAKQGGEE